MREARQILDKVKEDLEREGVPFDPRMPVGAMIEVPAAVTLAHLLAQQADFFSIGTNDLIQYALAIDRVNKQVAEMYQPLHPAVIRMIREVVHAARVVRIPVSMCGEMAGDPLHIPVLLGLGVAELSMNAMAIPIAKHIIRMITVEEARKIARHVLRLVTVEEINHYMAQEMNRRFAEIFRFGRTMVANLEL
jgi:phosphotransferase system enzyme I (PtsI)